MDDKKRIVYPEPINLKFILRYYSTKVDKYIKNNGNKDILKTHSREFAKLLVGDINDYEITIVDKLTNMIDFKCSRCGRILFRSSITGLDRDNLTFCPKCGLIRLVYNRSDIMNYISNNESNNYQYLILDTNLIIRKDLYNKAVMSVIGKLKNRLEKYINGDITAIEKSEELTEKEIKD